jgi:glycosyltransferase involved in cell wall biosynthesis
MNKDFPRISFGMIVLNGLPFIEYNLRSLYPFAYEIIVVEGACPASRENCTPDGHSIDGTIEVLRRFQKEHDPEKKLTIVIAKDDGQPDGFWPEKTEMSQAYAKRASGDYLWQIDVDEFYHAEDIKRVLNLLSDGSVTAVSFPLFQFWGGYSYILDGYFQRRSDCRVNRIFKWGPGSKYMSHRPPTVIDREGNNLFMGIWLNGCRMKQKKLYQYHYDMVLPIQAESKSRYYAKAEWHSLDGQHVRNWKTEIFDHLRDPFHIYTIYTHYSWLRRFHGRHPNLAVEMLQDIEAGKFPGITLRQTDDIDKLLKDWRYRWGCWWRLLVILPQAWFWSCKMAMRNGLIRFGMWGAVQYIRGKTS